MIRPNLRTEGSALALLASCLITACGAHEDGAALSVELPEQSVDVAQQALCPDFTGDYTLPLWPNGDVYYSWGTLCPKGSVTTPTTVSAADRTAIWASMARWEAITNGVVRFHYAPTMSNAEKVRIFGGECGFNEAHGRGEWAVMASDVVDHELGHTLGLRHHHQRYDRDHFMRNNSVGDACSHPDMARFDSPDKRGDFGAFDYASTMLYPSADSTFTRWDGSPLCGASNPQCSGLGSLTGAGPMGYPTRLDGSAIIESYRMDFAGWDKFKRTLNVLNGPNYSPGAQVPFNHALAPGVTIVGDPAVNFVDNAAVVYVRGSNSRLYEKWRTAPSGTWSNWADVSAGFSFAGSPGVTSRGAGRTDLSAISFSTGWLQLRSYANGAWGSWLSLGAPSVGIAPGSTPALTSWGVNRLDVFVRGRDDRLYWRRCAASNGDCSPASSAWSPWAVVGTGTFFGSPSVVSIGANSMDVYVHGKDHKVWSAWYNGQWNDFYQVNSAYNLYGTTLSNGTCPSCASPAAGARPGIVDVYVRGADSRMWLISWDGTNGWVPFGTLGGELTSSPATFSRTLALPQVAVTMIENGQPGTWVKTRLW